MIADAGRRAEPVENGTALNERLTMDKGCVIG